MEGLQQDPPQQPAGPERPQYEVKVSLNGKVNLADFQNAVPLLRELRVTNSSESKVTDVVIQVTSEPPFVRSRMWRIDAIDSGHEYIVKDTDVQLDGALLSRLTESETATLVLAVSRSGETPEELARSTHAVELLPRNHWAGLAHLPDMVAAFVQPNDPAVDRLLKETAEILRKNGRPPALDGYKGGAARAWELASAIWNAVVGLGVDYAYPPASFEQRGQKVRSPSQIADARIATCLDLALLFAAALEQVGLNPLVIFTKGHAFVGAWLKQAEFSTTVIDDITALRKRIRLKELVLFETTLVTQRPAVKFAVATENGAAQVAEEKDEDFQLAVDIRRARLQRIKPLASAEVEVARQQEAEQKAQELDLESPPDLPDGNLEQVDPKSLDPKDRLARWQRKLLDLSLRNNLLNFRSGKKALRLEAPDPGALEDLISDGHAVKLLPRPDLMDGADPRSQAVYESRNREDVRREHALDALKRREVFISLEQAELESRLVELFRTARTTLQEGGANTLYVALGFLTWTREKGGPKYKAPLILVPISLSRKSARSGFALTIHEDEPRFNPTLLEMLRQDFQLHLGVIEGELPRDDSGLDIAAIWKTVSVAIRDIPGWEVTDEAVLAMFSFAKYLMWKDLTERTDQLRENPVVRHLIDTPRDAYPSTTSFPDPKRLDAEYGPERTFCPLPADSSQLSAVMAAAKGKDFVLIGPPGTGKSQTISNLIAQCLAENKRVLFVSEKIAALDVVYRRLREVGLAEFCLELHSSKARKLDVLAQLQQAWEAQGQIDPEEWREQALRLGRHRDELNSYVERLHQVRVNGLTIYSAIGVLLAGDDLPSLNVAWPNPEAHSRQQLDAMRDVVERMAVNATAVGEEQLTTGALAQVEKAEWSPMWQQKFIDASRQVIPAAADLQAAAGTFLDALSFADVRLDRRGRAALASLATSLPSAAGHDWSFVLRLDARALFARIAEGLALVEHHRELTNQMGPLWPEAQIALCHEGLELLRLRRKLHGELGSPWPLNVVEDVNRGLRMLEQMGEVTRRLSVKYGEQVDQLNVHLLAREWRKAEESSWPLSWWRKRSIAKTLESAVASEGTLNVGDDLKLLVTLRDLKAEVHKIEVGPETDGVWAGLRTRPEFARTAAKFQEALAAARGQHRWTDEGFEPVAVGRCGPKLADDLGRMRTIQQLDSRICALEHLRTLTTGLWSGLATEDAKLDAALRFQAARSEVATRGTLPGDHAQVGAGACGSQLAADHRRLQQRAAIEVRLREYEDLKHQTGGLWAGLETAPDGVERVKQFHSSVAAAIANLSSSPQDGSAIHASLSRLLGEGNALLDPAGTIAAAAKQYVQCWGKLQPALDRVSLVGAFTEVGSSHLSELPLVEILQQMQQIIAAEHRLNAWCAWRRVRDEALVLGLAPLVAALESGGVRADVVRKVFETNYCRWWLNAVVDNEPVIRSFVAVEHEKRIADFRALDERFIQLTKRWVRASLCADLPKQDSVPKNSEWGILRNQISRKKGHMPLRELMTSIPEALTKLTPCLLMSPLSIAQYLAADVTSFDVVVFDEASQIPVWDAIGAIARGKQVVMVGDPKQLPPTSFFDRAESSLDDEDVEADLESILDECMGANLPTLNLSWHYRSRSESLIAFSNHRYYGGGLVTFPSPVTEDRAVNFQFVPGVYEKGGARTNKPEAKALVADIVARLKSTGFQDSGLTIGVVTFNTEQMTLIMDLLDDERRKDPALERYFDESSLEPLFVKNLESVQGDERDIMYFSITYGPDLTGAVSMNFGPMNRDGGERRLNVAITRARQELRVFSSLRAEQMDLARTQAGGVRDLKHFLEFAERGTRALAEVNRGSVGDFESPFEEAVAVALSRKGWQVHTQIGASAFRIDLAVVDPDAPGSYLAGVECDGATYHRSATARDRDMLREQVLRGLGWEILRVWSTDWWIDKESTLERLHLRLKGSLEASRERRALQQEADAAAAAARTAIDKARQDTVDADASPLRPIPVQGALLDETNDSTKGREDSSSDADVAMYMRNAGGGTQSPKTDFMEADPLSAVPGAVNADAFFDSGYDTVLRTMIEHVVGIEGPVLESVLARRIARAHGWQRTGARIQERVNVLAHVVCDATDEDVGVFYWPKGKAQSEVPFRMARDETARTVDEICLRELASLAKSLQTEVQGGDAVLSGMVRALGLSRVRAASRIRLEKAIQQAGTSNLQ